MSEIDRYLRDMSRRLAGAGPAGERALAEIEDHLRAAADEGIARGLTADAAEYEAVARFGKPVHIARQLRDAHRVAHLRRAPGRGVRTWPALAGDWDGWRDPGRSRGGAPRQASGCPASQPSRPGPVRPSSPGLPPCAPGLGLVAQG